jgi:SAM-dependent methyltransferase
MMHGILRRRAEQLFKRLQPHLPVAGRTLDVGSGTGHNGAAIEKHTRLSVVKLDVTDMNAVGGPVVVYDGEKIPFPDQAFQVVISLFVLQYIADPVAFLSELRRTGRGRLLIIQSVYAGVLGEVVLRAREFVQGRGAFRAARALKLVPNGADRMRPVHFYTLEELQAVFERAELEVVEHHRSRWLGLGVSRDLYVLEWS